MAKGELWGDGQRKLHSEAREDYHVNESTICEDLSRV